MTSYKWRDDSYQPKVPAETFGKTVEQLAAGSPLHLVPASKIIDAARHHSSPIHNLFMWDEARAAEKYREHEARKLLGMLEVVVVEVKEGRAISSRAFFNVRVENERGYTSRSRVMTDVDLKGQVIAGAAGELRSFLIKYRGVLAMGAYIPKLQQIIDEMGVEVDRLGSEATRPVRSRRARAVRAAPSMEAGHG